MNNFEKEVNRQQVLYNEGFIKSDVSQYIHNMTTIKRIAHTIYNLDNPKMIRAENKRLLEGIVGDKKQGLMSMMRKYELQNKKIDEMYWSKVHPAIKEILVYTRHLQRSEQMHLLGVENWRQVLDIKAECYKELYWARYGENGSRYNWDSIELNTNI